ncbi:MAG TPA: DUF4158 domain-containing protein [Microlunatus sp.]|nr:DUF4158 domain-containing protein [Microlunatus sp.]
MPVEFLSDDQAAAYERLDGDLTRSELDGFFLLDRTTVDLIGNQRGEHHRLGFGLQIGTVRYLGHFLTENPSEVPWSAVAYVAGQLGITDPVGDQAVLRTPPDDLPDCQADPRRVRLPDFADTGVREPLVEFMGARAWIHADSSVALFEQPKAWLRREPVLLPGTL